MEDSHRKMATAPPNPERIGKFRIERRLAVGGMAELFLARASGPGGFEKRCALKRMLPHLAVSPDFVDMFLDEARLAAQLSHPNVAQIFELARDDHGLWFIAMEFVDGLNLRQLIRACSKRGASIPLDVTAQIISQSLDGLHYAHHLADEAGRPLGVVHRDVSPQNLLLSTEGTLKIVDFGIAKGQFATVQTQSGVLRGKVSYMSPEQASGEAVDARSDLFALGVCFYELVTGVKPFRGPNDLMTLKAIIEQPPPPIQDRRPDCSPALQNVIYRALQKSPRHRYGSAREFQADLQAAVTPSAALHDRHALSRFIQVVRTAPPVQGPDPLLALAPPALPTSPPSPASDEASSGAVAAASVRGWIGDSGSLSQSMVRLLGAEDKRPLWGAALVIGLILGVAGVAFLPAPAGAPARATPSPELALRAAPGSAQAPPNIAVGRTDTAPPDAAPPATPTSRGAEPPPPSTPRVPPRAAPSAPPSESAAVEPPAPRPDREAASDAPAVQRRTRGYLSLTTEPPGIPVYLGRRRIGRTPLVRRPLRPGRRVLRLRAPELGIERRVALRIRPRSETTKRIEFSFGEADIRSRPWAKVFLGGRLLGQTPLRARLGVGEHTLELATAAGRRRQVQVRVDPSATTPVRVKFTDGGG